MPLTPEMAQSKSPSQSQTSHRVHKQLLAGLPNALQGHVHIFLPGEAIHAVVQGVWDSFGHLNTQREKSSMRKRFFLCKHSCTRVGNEQWQYAELKNIGKFSTSIYLTLLFTIKSPLLGLLLGLTSCLGKGDTVQWYSTTYLIPKARLSGDSVIQRQNSPILCQVLKQN